MKIRLTQLTNSLNIPHMKYSRLLTAIMMLTGVENIKSLDPLL